MGTDQTLPVAPVSAAINERPFLINSPRMRWVRYWSWLQLPRTHRLLTAAGVWDQARWRGEPIRVCRGCWHGYRMALDISDFHQRGAYFQWGRWDIDVQLCLLAGLRPGDVFVDVGANIGLHTLLAARAVGARGRVIAFEPNPDVFWRLTWHVEENGLRQVDAQPLGLSDRNDTLRLRVPPTGNTGAGTLGILPGRHRGRIAAEYDVPVRIGDEVLTNAPRAPMLIKVDVEGHEPAVLKGLARTIQRHAPALLLECNTELLPLNHSSAGELLAFLQALGYEPFSMGSKWRRLARKWQLQLDRPPSSWVPARTLNILFLRPGGVHAARYARYITPMAF
jgi:FkbM family methyltransferase